MVHNRRLKIDEARQREEGYQILWTNIGPDRFITYIEKGREIDVLADFSLSNYVTLYTDSLRYWSMPTKEEVSELERPKILRRVVRYLSCWGDVQLDDRHLTDSEDIKRSLREDGIEFTETDDGLIVYNIDAQSVKRGSD